MLTVAIRAERDASGQTTYRAVAGKRQSFGRTAGEALDALRTILDTLPAELHVVVPDNGPDAFFTAEQQARLSALMAAWHAARDSGRALAPEEQSELQALVEAELRGAAMRAAASHADRSA